MTGLALAVPVLGGLLLYAAGVPLQRPGWLGLLAGVTLAADTALFARRRAALAGRVDRAATQVPPASQVQTGPSARLAPGGSRPTWRVSPGHVAVFAVAILVAAGAVGLAAFGAARQPQPGFTQLWLSPQQDASTLSLGVTNDQGRTTSYRLVLQRDGQAIDTWNLTLGEGRTWQRQVQFTGNEALTARLYRLPDLTHIYRYVSIGRASGAAGS
jgi:hypothetical protein